MGSWFAGWLVSGLGAAAILCISPNDAIANEDRRAAAADALRSGGTRFGRGVVEILSEDPGSSEASEAAISAVEKMAKAHAERQRVYGAGADILDGALITSSAGTALGATVLTKSPFIGAGVYIAAEIARESYMEDFRGRMERGLEQMVWHHRDEIQNAIVGNLDAFPKMSEEELRNVIRNAPEMTARIDKLFGGDPAFREMAEGITVDILRATDDELLRRVGTNAESLEEVEKDLAGTKEDLERYEEKTAEALRLQEQSLSTLSESLAAEGERLGRMERRLEEQANDAAIVNDFMMSQMPAAAKAAALRAGFGGERLVCGQAENCDAAAEREKLIKKYDNEARIDEQRRKIERFAHNVTNIVVIAEDFGIDTGDANRVVAAVNAGSRAFSALLEQDYLGAAAALTGLMGNPVDPAAERHEELMDYLDKKFEKLQETLTTVVKNQEIISNQIAQLAEASYAYYAALDSRLDTLSYKQDLALELLQSRHWSDWEPCNTMVQDLRDAKLLEAVQERGFDSSDAIFSGIRASGAFARECLIAAHNKLQSLQDLQTFGNFLSAEFALNSLRETEEQILSNLQNYVRDIFEPTLAAVLTMLQEDGRSLPLVYQSLAAPPATLATFDDQYAAAQGDVSCSGATSWTESVQTLLCGYNNSTPFPADRATLLLRKPLVSEGVIRVSDWVRVVAPLADYYDHLAGSWIRPDALIGFFAGNSVRRPTGERLMEGMIGALDAALASATLQYGPHAAHAFARALSAAPAEDEEIEGRRREQHSRIHTVLELNAILARNTALVLMTQAYGVRNGDGDITARKIRPHTYRAALDYALENPDKPGLYLQHLFGSGIEFRVRVGQVQVLVSRLAMDPEPPPGGGNPPAAEIWVNAPQVDQFVNGRIEYPFRVQRMSKIRAEFVDMLLDYQIPRNLTDQEIFAFIGRMR